VRFFNPPEENQKEKWPEGLASFIEAGTPPVYFTFGSMMLSDLSEIRKILDVWKGTVHQLGCRAILQVPWEDLSVFTPDQNVFIVNRSPYAEVFPRCVAIVHHGGAGTTQSSLLAGRPSVVVAHMADQTFWGTELKRLGVAGETLQRKNLTSQKLAKIISTVLANQMMTKKAILLGNKMAEENGTAKAVEYIEKSFNL
jgi:sterol 3beta-glucosyltransferase